MARKLRLAILYNLREKSGAKIKNWQSYSNPRDLNDPSWRTSPVLEYYSCSKYHGKYYSCKFSVVILQADLK